MHLENEYASRQVKRPRGPRPAALQLCGDPAPALPSTADDVKALAMTYVGLTLFARTHCHSPAAAQAAHCYSQLLLVAKNFIESLDQDNLGICLLTIFFLTRYEDTTYQPRPGVSLLMDPLRSAHHHDGAVAVLKFWKDRLSHKSAATHIVKCTRRGTIKSALLRRRELSLWIGDGALFGEHGVELEYDRVCVGIINIRARLFSLLQEWPDIRQRCDDLQVVLEMMDGEVQAVDAALQAFIKHFPKPPPHQRHTLRKPDPWPTANCPTLCVESYPDMACAMSWGQYYSMRMVVLSTRLRVLKLRALGNDEIFSEEIQDCQSCVEAMADGMASTIPFLLGRYEFQFDDALSSPAALRRARHAETKPYLFRLTALPLTIASSVECLGGQRQMWFRRTLARVGRESGFGLFAGAESDHWLQI